MGRNIASEPMLGWVVLGCRASCSSGDMATSAARCAAALEQFEMTAGAQETVNVRQAAMAR